MKQCHLCHEKLKESEIWVKIHFGLGNDEDFIPHYFHMRCFENLSGKGFTSSLTGCGCFDSLVL